jgi:hypothetical protein
MDARSTVFLGPTVALSVGLASCATSVEWIADREQLSALAPNVPDRCEREELVYRPGRRALLGGPPSELWNWAERTLPDSFRLGHHGRLALLPNRSPGVALHATVAGGHVASLVVQSHAATEASAPPLSHVAVRRFLLDATRCDSFRLCRAMTELDGIRFQGHTTCSSARVPMTLVTPRHGRQVVSVAVWIPAIDPRGSEGDTTRRLVVSANWR